MTPSDRRLPEALGAAVEQLKAAVAAALDKVLHSLMAASQTAARVIEREEILETQLALRHNARSFLLGFNQSYDERLQQELTPRADSRRSLGQADWETLTLVEDKEVEGRLFADRLGQQMAASCEWELRELAGYVGTLLSLGRAVEDRNPLRPVLIAQALYESIETLTDEQDARRLLAHEFGTAMAALLPGCYGSVSEALRQQRVQPVRLSFRGVEGPGNHLSGVNSGYATLQDEPLSTRGYGGGPASGHTSGRSSGHSGGHDGGEPSSLNASSQHASGFVGSGPLPAASAGSRRSGSTSASSNGRAAAAAADRQLMSLLRRLTQIASRHGEFDAGPGAPPIGSGWPPARAGAGITEPIAAGGGEAAQAAGLMAVNLIHAHREELLQASSGKLDHMVIDVVGSLFDQILSDPRVPPQMARQIARLQLPVLRVALVDASFFSSRRHPVRRFVNRIASLACAFDDFSQGPGEQFLASVSRIVQDIVDGDFDRAELYTAKVAELEQFIAGQTGEPLRRSGAAAVLEHKESELQVQQRYMQQLKAALAPVTMPDYLRAFLCQVWSQALVMAADRGGADADLSRRLRDAGRDMVLSVQPKGSPQMRKRFLMQLPTLMKDLQEGLALIRWPDAARKQFLGQLLPSHAESLKGASLTELDYNLLGRQLDHIFDAAIPGRGSSSTEWRSTSDGADGVAATAPADGAPPLPSTEIEQRFTAQEAAQVGLVGESAVDWNEPVARSTVDVDLGALAAVQGGDDGGDGNGDSGGYNGDNSGGDEDAPMPPPAMAVPIASAAELDIDLTLTTADPAQAPGGADLMAHIRLGFAYRMLLKNEWQKVRLSYVSPGRSFFVFSRGREHKETISVTARMLVRMCESGRLRAVENAYLMERATARARKQLAAMRNAPAAG